MLLTVGRFIWTYLNKFITLTFFALFTVSLFIKQYQERPMFTIYVIIALLLLNLFNFMVIRMKGLAALFEAIIYEAIAILGVYYVSLYYVLVFVLVAEVLHYFRSKVVLATIMFANSILYVFAYLNFSSNGYYIGFYLWHMLVSLFVTIALSIYFAKSEEYYEDTEKVKNPYIENEMEQKYNELLKEHQEVVLLKNIMDLSNRFSEIKDLVREVNYQLIGHFGFVDFSTIFLYDEKRKSFRIITSNIPTQYHKAITSLEQIDEFADVINEKHGKMLNSELELKYPTARERGIRSALCVPLHTSKELLGLVLMESHECDTFNSIDINKFNLIRYNISLIVENKQWVDRIEKMALVDGLTGVYNRNYLFDFLEKQMKWHKDNQKSMCLIMYDIDHFKKFNDTYGHLFGDLVLKETSNLVKGMIRDIDLIARYGGEEFIVILVDMESITGKERIEEVRRSIEYNKVRSEEGVQANVTVSFGLAEYKNGTYDLNIKDLIERADQALYKSKQEGRNKVTVYRNE